LSDQEGFLTRWSRLKREADEAAPDAPAAVGDASAPMPPTETDDPAAAEPKKAAEPIVDLKSLPPLESITAGSDIRAFLAPGIPAQLTRAALRRAWIADPAIRDFVGLSENAWDFNAPDAVPGFGPLLPSPGVRQMIADAMGQEHSRSALLSSGDGEALQKPDVSARHEEQAPHGAGTEAPAVNPAPPAPGETGQDAAAAQEEEPSDHPIRAAQRHGGALPR